MPDREKVITEIEDALSGNLAKAGNVYRMSLNELKDKALKDALTLLKEQEPVEPSTDIVRNRRCPKCFTILKGKFCHECGQAVKWK